METSFTRTELQLAVRALNEYHRLDRAYDGDLSGNTERVKYVRSKFRRIARSKHLSRMNLAIARIGGRSLKTAVEATDLAGRSFLVSLKERVVYLELSLKLQQKLKRQPEPPAVYGNQGES